MIWNMFFQNMREKSRIPRRNKTGFENGRRHLRFLVMIFFLFLSPCVLSGCSSSLPEKNVGLTNLQVVTTIFPQYDFVRQIGGEHVSLQMLLKPGEETHSYEPTPQDILAIQRADLFIYVGGENDEWVEDILDSPEMNQVHTLRLVDCVDMLAKEEHVEGMQKERHTWFDAEEEETDEHVWTSPRNAMRIVEKITEELVTLDSAHQEEYEANRKTYIEQLSKLDMQFQNVAEKAAQQGCNLLLFGDRFPFLYFAQEYGFEYYAAFPGCASDTEPSAATMAFLIRKVKEEQLPVVLKMELSSNQIANAIAEATDAQVRIFYSCHNLTAQQFEAGDGYLSMMQENLETLKEALKIDGIGTV